jgi:hypothetical protein
VYCIILSNKSLLKNPCDNGPLSHIKSWLGFLSENFAKNFNQKIEGKKKRKKRKKPCHPVYRPQFETWIRHLDLGTWNLHFCSGKLGFEGEEETKGRVERRRRRRAAQHQREIQDFVVIGACIDVVPFIMDQVHLFTLLLLQKIVLF